MSKPLSIIEAYKRYKIDMPKPLEPFIYNGNKIKIPHICNKCNAVFLTKPNSVWGYRTKSCGHCDDPKIGDKFNRLIIIKVYPSKAKGCSVECVCDCGNMWKGQFKYLKNNNTQSCGCLQIDNLTSKINTVLTIEQQQILDGLLLGDGYLTRYRRNAYFRLKVITKSWTNLVKQILPFQWGKDGYTKELKEKNKHHYSIYYCITLSDIFLTKQYNRWYPNNKKIVPKDIKITPLLLKHWFYGDGSSYKVKNKNSVSIKLSTDGFTLVECRFLVQKLRESIGITFKTYKHNNNSKNRGYVLIISDVNSIKRFFQYIGPPDKELIGNKSVGFSYKWKIPGYDNWEDFYKVKVDG